MAVLVAKFWGVLPHVIWRYPFRYYLELRNAVVDSNRVEAAVEKQQPLNWDDSMVEGEPV